MMSTSRFLVFDPSAGSPTGSLLRLLLLRKPCGRTLLGETATLECSTACAVECSICVQDTLVRTSICHRSHFGSRYSSGSCNLQALLFIFASAWQRGCSRWRRNAFKTRSVSQSCFEVKFRYRKFFSVQTQEFSGGIPASTKQ